MGHYLKLAARRLIRRPSYSIPAILVLALAMGANTAVFSIVNGVLLRPLPYADADRIVVISTVRRSNGKISGASYQDLDDWRRMSTQLTDITGLYALRYTAIANGAPNVVETAVVASSFFSLTGLTPSMGRPFNSSDDTAGAAPVVLISHSFWLREFGGNPDAVGKTLTLDRKPYNIIGVMSPTAMFPLTIPKAELWVPMVPSPGQPRTVRAATALGKLKPGVSLQQAQAEMDSIAKRLSEATPGWVGFDVSLANLQESLVGKVRTGLWFLQGAVALLLLVACSNAAHLALITASNRIYETAVEAALGAQRRHILWQILAEGLVVGLVSAVIGTAMAWGAVRLFLLSMPDILPRQNFVSLDWAVLAVTALAGILSALIFALAPALLYARHDLADFMRQGARASSSVFSSRARAILAVSQIALTVILAVNAVTLMSTFLDTLRTPWGFQPDDVLAMDVVLPFSIYGMGPKSSAFFEKALAGVSGVAGVTSAGLNLTLPFAGDGLGTVVLPVGQPDPPPGQEFRSRYRPVTAGYFKTLGIPLIRGREFEDRDRYGSPGVAIIDEALARQLFKTTDPIGQQVATRIKLTPGDPADWTVVGIVGGIKDSPDDKTPQPHIYVPHLQQGWSLMSLVVRSGREPGSLAKDVVQAIRGVDPGQAVQQIGTMNEKIAKSVALPRVYAALITAFAVIALIVSCLGIYGTTAYSASWRTREIGVRMAMGADTAGILRLFLGLGAACVAAGTIVGIAGAFAIHRWLSSVTPLLQPIHISTLAVACLVVVSAGIAASYLPARRASKLAPMAALRHD